MLGISTPSGSWPDLVLDKEYWPIFEFQTDVSSLGDFPAGATLTIPEDTFPAFNNVSIHSVERNNNASLSNVVGNRLTSDTKVTWALPTIPNPNGMTAIWLHTRLTDAVNGMEQDITVFCTVADDGEFGFPDNTRQLLSNYGFSIEGAQLSRSGITSEVLGDAAVLLFNANFYSF